MDNEQKKTIDDKKDGQQKKTIDDKKDDKQKKTIDDENDNEEEKTIDQDQVNFLGDIVNNKDLLSILIKIPKDEYNDEGKNVEGGNISSGSISGGSMNKDRLLKKYGYTFNIEGFESNSIAYFNEILLGYRNKANCFHIDFNFKDLLSLDLATLEFCKKMLNPNFELKGDIDGVIINVEKNVISKAIKENKYNIFTSMNYFKESKFELFDIFCESTFGLMDKLKNYSENKSNRKIVQLKKMILIELY